VPTSFTLELYVKLMRSPKPGEELLRFGSSASGFVALTTDAAPSSHPGPIDWAFNYGPRASQVVFNSPLFQPRPFEWTYLAFMYNTSARIIDSFVNSE
jgi:hypothetical protein